MAFIGTPLDTRNTFQSLQGKRFSGDGSETEFTLDVAPSSTLDIEVFVGNVRQDPNSAYTVSGTTLTFTGAPPSGTNNIYVVHQAKSVGTIDVPALGVSTASLQANSVTGAKLNTDVISAQTALGATPADTDEFLVSDAGTIKRVDYSYIKGSSTIGGLTDVSMDITNFSSGLLIQPNSSGSAPTTGTLNSASFNVGIGKDVFKALTEGDDNVAIGTNAGQALTTGSDNLFVGRDCGYGITTGEKNLCIGATSMGNNDTESHNMAIGFSTLNAAINGGEYNVAIGNYAGDAITSGDYNTILGYTAGSAVTTGEKNTIVGDRSAPSLTTGGPVTLIGSNNDVHSSGCTDLIALGHNLTVSANNQFRFGNGGTDNVYNQYATNASWTRSSDERIKKDIKPNDDCGLDFINDLRTVTFKRRAPSELPKHFDDYDANDHEPKHKEKLYGMIAQEVKTALDKHNITDFGGWTADEVTGMQKLSQEMFVYPLIKAVQELSAKVTELEKKLEDK